MKSPIIIIFIVSLICPFLCVATDTITHITPLTINQTLVSNGQVFELGFFNPTHDNLFIGIWYKQIIPKTYVWVANRDTPITSLFGVLSVIEKGNILLLDQAESVVSAWSSNVSFLEGNTARNTVAQLLGTGNFVLKWEDEENPDNYIWQSFDHPTDTLLPEMKIGLNRETGVNRFLQSWKTTTDPGSGDYSFKMDPDGFQEFYISKNETVTYRSGSWNGKRFSGVPEIKTPSLIKYEYQNNSNEISYSFRMLNASVYSRLIISPSGLLQRFTWVETWSTWSEFFVVPRDQCDNYLKCGPYGICDSNASPVCKCMKGFRPRNQQAWDLRDGSDGCIRSSEMDCGSDGFLLLKSMKLPKSSNVFVDNAMNLSQCGEICKRNCSCGAYANMDIRGYGSGCVIWEVDLLDMRECADSEGGGQDLYIRVAASDLDQFSTHTTSNSLGNDNSNHIVTIMAFSISGCVVAIILLILFYLRRRKIRRLKKLTISRKVIVRGEDDYYGETNMDELELPLFDFSNMALATNNFSDDNKLGEGGFGYVYKGILTEGVVVAVKRLSRVSDQGIEELRNEVRLIAKLQHRNLVRLLGCCIEVEEKLLIYEFMENKSLNTFLFEKEKSMKLNWQMRLDIIFGIARGLLYLHQDSRFKIIHRDLKASNVLLDKEMNPKISDFGMARIFESDQIEDKTKKVVGTYGYMSPEYAMNGNFSTKSDVFSFGVLVLEIVSGKKNTGSSYTSSQLSLLGYSWTLWKEGNALGLVDKSMGDKFSGNEVLRCVQIGLLCVQEHPEDRPSMAKVLSMLSSESVQLPQPKCHGYFIGERRSKIEPLNKQDDSMTVNEVTLTVLDAR